MWTASPEQSQVFGVGRAFGGKACGVLGWDSSKSTWGVGSDNPRKGEFGHIAQECFKMETSMKNQLRADNLAEEAPWNIVLQSPLPSFSLR